MTRHFRAEVLATYLEGEVRRRKAARISAHIRTCIRCSGVVSDLKQVPALLHSVPAPPMPDSLSVRIEMALTAESRARVAGEPASEGGRRDLPARITRPRRRWELRPSSPLARSLVAAGAAVVIAGGGYALATHVGAPSSSSSSAVQAPRQAAGAAVPAGGGMATRFGPAVVYRYAGQTHSVYSVETGTDFKSKTLSSQARSAVTTSNSNNNGYAQHAIASSGGAGGTKVDLAQLEGCVSNVSSGRNVLLVDIAKFDSKPAYVIVVGPAPSGPGVAYAVGTSCSATSKDILAQQYMPRA